MNRSPVGALYPERAAGRLSNQGTNMTKSFLIGAMALGLMGLSALPACERATTVARAEPLADPAKPVPRLVDLGAGKCIPCKAMAPILEGLKAEYAGRMEVQFIDVWKDPDAAKPYGIRMIPTQIFYGADGQELARHEGFMARDEILAQWKRSGVSL
jgi:thioredoxin 1